MADGFFINITNTINLFYNAPPPTSTTNTPAPFALEAL
jgi:hypothetical protein